MQHGYNCNFTASKRENIIDADDHISQLPDAILSYIFTFLNVKEALRTRLMSHRWRDLRVPVSNLVFDPTLITGLYHEQFLNYSIVSPLKYKFVERVDQFLNIITVQKPITLKICFPLGQEFASHINGWIRLAVEMECEEIELDLDWATRSQDGNNSEPYNFPCHLLLSCGKSYLKDLSLRECIFKPPLEVASGLNSLKSLRLDGVPVEASDLEIILSGCLNLERLGLMNCELLCTIRICGQDLTLKCLTVSSSSILKKIELSVPNLEKFEFEYESLPDFTFSRLHQLKKIVLVIYETTERGLNQMLDELSTNVPHLQKLSLTGRSSQYGRYLTYTSNYNHTPMFENLTHLVLAVRRGYGWNMFTYVLYRSPRLEVLVLNKGPTLYGEPSWIPPQLVPACVSSCLKKVCFERFDGDDNALRFAGYILENASILETMKVNITICSSELKRHITNKIKAFSRSSEACQVLYDD